MANNNDILELFELVGSVTIDLAKSIKELNIIDKKANDVTNSMTDKFKKMAETLKKIEISPEMDTNKAVKELEQFKKEYGDVLKELEGTASIDLDTNAAIKDMNRLYGQANRLQKKIESGNIIGKNSAVTQMERTLETVKKLEETMQFDTARVTKNTTNAENNNLGGRFFKVLDRLTESIDSLKVKINGFEKKINTFTNRLVVTESISDGINPQTTPNGEVPANSPPSTITSVALGAGLGSLSASYNRRLPSYDLERSQALMEAYQRKMLAYAMKLNPSYILQKANQKLNFSNSAWDIFTNAKNMRQIQATFGIIESGITNSRRQLSLLGFDRTKQEIKAIEGQMQAMANTRLDNLRDQIKLTEKALKEMKKSANADQYVDEIKNMEAALKTYKDELKNANPAQVIANANGYKAGTAWGKNVIYKPFTNALDKMGGRIVAFVNKDLAYLQNKTYEALDKAGKAIVGDQGTKMLTKAKIGQLATQYQMIGQTINQYVTPAVLGLSAALAAVGVNADKGWSKFQAQTLMKDSKMLEIYKNQISDVSASTGESMENVGQLFAYLHNVMGKSKDDIAKSAEIGLNFSKVWDDIDATTAIENIDKISKKLGVSEKKAADMMAFALKKHHGDITQATKDVLTNEKAWKKRSKSMIDGKSAYDKMVSSMEDNGLEKTLKAFRTMGNSLQELYKQIEPTVIAIANAITKAANSFKEFLRNNPGMAKATAYLMALATAAGLFIAVATPLAGFLLMNRNLFQALGQSLKFAGKGMVAMNPAARALYDTMMLTKNGIIGLPRIMRSLVPGLLSVFRGLPGMIAGSVIQFIKINPILSTIATLSWVIFKNWDKFEPVLQRIWKSLKRIGESILTAFAGEGSSNAQKFSSILDKIAKVAGNVLLPAFKVLANILEVVARLMENGGGKAVVYGGGVLLLASAVGKLIQNFKNVGGVIGGATKALGKFSNLAKKVNGSKVSATVTQNTVGSSPIPSTTPNSFEKTVAKAVHVTGSPVYVNGSGSVQKSSSVGSIDSNRAKNISKKARTKKIVIPNVDMSSSVKSVEKSGIFSKITKLFAKKAPGILKIFGKVLIKVLPRVLGMLTGPIGTTLMVAFDVVPFLLKNKSKIVSGFTKFGKWCIKGLKKGLSTISTIASTIVGWLDKYLVNPVKSFLGIASPSKLFAKFGRWIIQGLVNGMRSSLGRIKSVLNSIKNRFSSFGKQVYKIVSTYFLRIYKRISGLMSSVRKRISSILTAIRRSFSSVLHQVWKIVSSIFQRIYNTIRGWLNRTRNFISGALSKIQRAFSNTFSRIYNGIKNRLGNIYSKIKNTFNNIGSFFSRLARRAWSWGSNVAEGITGGIISNISNAVDAIERLGHKISSAFKKYMGIHSPSRLMYKIARWIPRGVVNAIVDGTADVGKAAKGMGKKVEDDFDPNPNNPEFPNADPNPKGGGFGSMSVGEIISSVVSAAVPTRSYDPVAALAGMSSNTTNHNFNNRHTSVDTININVKKLQTDEDIDSMYRKVVGKMDKEVRRRKR